MGRDLYNKIWHILATDGRKALKQPTTLRSLFSDRSECELKDLRVNEMNEVDVIISLGREKTCNLQEVQRYVSDLLKALKIGGVKKTRIVLQFDEKDFKTKDGVRYLRGDATLGALKNAERNLKSKYNVEIYYSEHIEKAEQIPEYLKLGVLWNREQVENANLCVKRLAEYIIKNKLSPLEAIAFISAFAYKNFEYNHVGEFGLDSHIFEKNNNIVSAIAGRKIRCVGYSQFFDAVVGELQSYFGGKLTSRLTHIIAYDAAKGRPTNGHAISQIYIDDKKYGLKAGDLFVDIDDRCVNYFKRPIEDKNENTMYEEYMYKGVPIHKTNDGKFLNNNGDAVGIKGINQEIVNNPRIIASKARWVEMGYILVDDGRVDNTSTIDQSVVTNEDIVRAVADSEAVDLDDKREKRIARMVLGAYDRIKEIKIPTVEELLEGRKITPADKGCINLIVASGF